MEEAPWNWLELAERQDDCDERESNRCGGALRQLQRPRGSGHADEESSSSLTSADSSPFPPKPVDC